MFVPATHKDNPFSLGDPTASERILSEAGLAEVRFTDVNQPVYYGQDADAALEWVSGFLYVKNCLQHMDSASAQRVMKRMSETLFAQASEEGVWFNSPSWLVTAKRPS